MNSIDYKSASGVDKNTAAKESLPPLWEAEHGFKAFKVAYGSEAPREYTDIKTDAAVYFVKAEKTEFKDDGVVIAIWYIKKIGERPRKEKAVVKGFRDKNPDAGRYPDYGREARTTSGDLQE